MLNQTLKLTFHLLVVANYMLFLKHCTRVNDELNAMYPGREVFMGQWKYLTHLNVAMQMGLFALLGLDDVLEVFIPALRKSLELRAVIDFVFSTLAFPVGVFVSVSFWGLYAINRELVFPGKALLKCDYNQLTWQWAYLLHFTICLSHCCNLF